MGVNGFREDELVRSPSQGRRRVADPNFSGSRSKVADISRKQRSAQHQDQDHRAGHDFVVIRAAAKTTKGKVQWHRHRFDAERRSKLADSLVELAETRAIARALRFGGVGCESTSAEEVSHMANTEPEQEQPQAKRTNRY